MRGKPRPRHKTGAFDLRKLRIRTHEILEAGSTNDKTSLAFDGFLICLILLNVIAFAVGTVPEIEARYGDQLELFNTVSVIVFTVEYVARLWSCVDVPLLRDVGPWRSRLRFALRPLMIVDLAAILPFYLSVLFAIDLRVLRVLRLLRFFKLARYSPALQTLSRVLANEKHALYGALIVMLSLILLSSTVIYFLEREAQPEVFGSVPAAAWWSLATLTTVGYGDVVPVTAFGKLFGGLVMIFGLGMFAIPIAIVATGFSQEIGRREFVVTWSMVAKVPLFAELDARAIASVVSHLRAISFGEGAVIIHEDEKIDALYFVAAGEVIVHTAGRPATVAVGDFFGEAALLRPGAGTVRSVVAHTRCDLLVLEHHDLAYLMNENPDIAEKVHAVMAERERDGWQAPAKKS